MVSTAGMKGKQTAPLSEPTEQAALARTVWYGALALLLVGIAWRTLRYLLRFPIWGDESFICLNVLERDYPGLTQPLRFVQVAPLLFLWAEHALLQLLGGSELSMRLLSYLAGIGALLLYCRLARKALPPLAAALAIGILAVSYYPVRHGCEVKAYAMDLFWSVTLLLLAFEWLENPARLVPPALLTLLVPLALGMSYPATFVAGAISLVLLPTAWRQQARPSRGLYLAYNLLLLASFLGYYWLVGVGQWQSEGGNDNHFFSDWFPPAEPCALCHWLIAMHTGNLMAYPVGGHTGGSTLTFLLVLTGIGYLARGRRWRLLGLCLAPFAMTFAAAALHRYPYGGSARVSQHLAPLICLLAGTGLAALLMGLFRSTAARRWGATSAFVALALLGVVGAARDWLKPHKTDGDFQIRQAVRDLVRQAGADDQIVVMEPGLYLPAPLEWYLRQEKKVAWTGKVDWQRYHDKSGQLWTLYSNFAPSAQTLAARFEREAGRPVVLLEDDLREFHLGWGTELIEYYHAYRWQVDKKSQAQTR